ncbi:hypothetical protein D3C81_2052580 [compost metagenome]
MRGIGNLLHPVAAVAGIAVEHDHARPFRLLRLLRSDIFAVHFGTAHAGKIQMKTFGQPAGKFRRQQFVVQGLGIKITQGAFPE